METDGVEQTLVFGSDDLLGLIGQTIVVGQIGCARGRLSDAVASERLVDDIFVHVAIRVDQLVGLAAYLLAALAFRFDPCAAAVADRVDVAVRTRVEAHVCVVLTLTHCYFQVEHVVLRHCRQIAEIIT